ncbi:MAG TPA: histidine phosphatase family protein [Acidimicrobiales bacterium]
MVHRAGRRGGRPPTGLDLPLTAVRLHLVRHGRAAAGWDDDPDPPLDDVGREQADAVAERLASAIGRPLPVVASPLLRCRQTAAPIATRWGVDVAIEPLVAEIPSPEGVPMGERVAWLRTAMASRWSELGPRYVRFRDAVVGRLLAATAPVVVVSHFVAINAAIGAALGDDRMVLRSLDNCSVTVLEVDDGVLHLVEGGHEADTLIR